MPELSQVDIRIGTSGFSFKDWRGTFYPDNVAAGKMLDYYVQHFRTVEINSTYYRIPHPAVMHNLVSKSPDGFDFIVKVPQTFTHRRSDLDKDRAQFAEAVRPLAEAGKLSGLLAQFPFSFKFSPDALDYISICRDAVAPYQLFVEFRHDSWVNRTMYDRLRAEGISYVCVDEPTLKGLLKPDFFVTSSTGYIRLHGRNAQQWWDGGPLRYDYSYSGQEMEEWQAKLMKSRAEMNRLYIFFNNCHRGQAARNALEFDRLLRGSDFDKE